jgi:hypothetical protein
MSENKIANFRISRRKLMTAAGATLAVGVAGCGTVRQQPAQPAESPSTPGFVTSKPPAKDRSWISDEGFRNTTFKGKKGFEVQLRVSSYRSIPLWTIKNIGLKVDGKAFDSKEMIFTLDGCSHKLEDLQRLVGKHWFVLDYAILFVPKADGLAAGSHEVEGSMTVVNTTHTGGTTTNSSKKSLMLESEI